MGSVNVTNVGNYVTKFDRIELPGDAGLDCAGRWGGACGTPTAEFKNNLRVTWYTPWDVSVSSIFRHTGEIEAVNANQQDLGQRTYWDASVAWQATEETSFRAGIQNILDREPPFNDAGPSIRGNGNTFPGFYDALGRYIFIGASMSF